MPCVRKRLQCVDRYARYKSKAEHTGKEIHLLIFTVVSLPGKAKLVGIEDWRSRKERDCGRGKSLCL